MYSIETSTYVDPLEQPVMDMLLISVLNTHKNDAMRTLG